MRLVFAPRSQIQTSCILTVLLSFTVLKQFGLRAEFYLYGRVTNAGGKDRANIHIQTDDYGLVIIKTPISVLEKLEGNILYRTFGVRVIGKQHTETGELDRSDIRFVELIDYHPTYDEDYLQSLRSKAKKNWLGSVKPDDWLRELRGSYDA